MGGCVAACRGRWPNPASLRNQGGPGSLCTLEPLLMAHLTSALAWLPQLCSPLALVSIFFSVLYVEDLLELSFPLQKGWSNVLCPLALSEPELAPAAEQSMKRENSSAALEF